jgi:AraC-like DNA-binding protein
MTYQRTHLQPTIAIETLITLYYFEFGKTYVYEGERHNFWEFLYVDKGEVEVFANERRCLLQQGMIIFHKPNEFHRFHANGRKAPNVIVMSFDCHSPAMRHFEEQVLHLGDEEKKLLTLIIEEGMGAFSFPFRHPLKDHRNPDAPVGSEQLIRLYLELFLLRLLRKIGAPEEACSRLSSSVKEKNDEALVSRVISYLEENMDSGVSLSEISSALHLSKTRLKELFKKQTGQTIMEYFAKMKIEKAKLLIREEASNFTEIAGKLGFGSVHYFSRAFKKATSMSPSEYAKSVKGRITRMGT